MRILPLEGENKLIMMSMLSEKEKAVVETITMRFHAPEALVYLKDHGMEMGLSTYYRYKKKVEDMKLERMQFIAQHFSELHLEKIDRMDLIDKLMWEQFENEQQPYRKVKILESIANLQYMLSGYYEASAYAIKVSGNFNPNSNPTPDKEESEPLTFDEWFAEKHTDYEWRIGDETDEENGRYYRELQKKYNEYVEDWNFHKGLSSGPDPCKIGAWTVDQPMPKTIVIDPPKEEPPKPTEELKTEIQPVATEEKPIQNDIIDLDIAGRYPMPIDYQYSWVQCKFTDCQKWFKTGGLRSKHVEKYHT